MSTRWIQHSLMLLSLVAMASAVAWVSSARAQSATISTKPPLHRSVCAPAVGGSKNLMTATRLCRPWA